MHTHCTTITADEVDALLERMAALVTTDLSPARFHAQLLDGAVRQGVSGAAIWCARNGMVERVYSTGDAAFDAEMPHDVEHAELVQSIVREGAARIVSCTGAELGGLWPATDTPSVIAPFFVDEKQAAGALELMLPSASGASEREAALELATALAELAGDFYRRKTLAEYRAREAKWRSIEQFLGSIHCPSLSETATALVNEGRWLVGCDRVSLICKLGQRLKVLAVSGNDRLELRSNLMRRMEDLADIVIKTDEPLWHTGEATDRAPEIDHALQRFVEESHARMLVALPLRPDRKEPCDVPGAANSLGVVVLERFAVVSLGESDRERIEAVTRHGALAVANALETDQLPLICVNRSIARAGWLVKSRQLPKTLWAAGGLLALVVALLFVPADFEIRAEGELQPREQRRVFAPADGVVDEVFVEHGDDVQAGRPLVRIRSTNLDFECARLQGEIQTAEKRLAAIGTARLELASDKATPTTTRYLQLTSEEEELKETLKSLRRQQGILNQECADLEVRSPLAGRVLSWDVARELSARPVQRGQELLAVGDIAGRWEVALRVPDDQVGYLLAAQDEARRRGESLTVSFVLAGDAGTEFGGEVERIALRSQSSDQDEEPFVLVTVRFDEQQIDGPRPGAGVVGKIDCGRRSLGFVWMHEAWNSIRRRVFF
jgi:multidrug efflux pump subunit AcrA (membrane-fusion protein)